MKYLLDTCILLWCLEGNTKKLTPFLDIIEDAENDLAVSVVTYWEIVIKQSLGKLDLPPLDELIEIVKETGFSTMSLDILHIRQLEKMPLIHNDPFDRLLIAQSVVEQVILLTTDEKILLYPEMRVYSLRV
ncbi:MAG: type II toxin-antitoxin system VapC family toxin [Legionellales bacterium]|nr:type II toxin-antitoxin system VapC family toxin [Legionellales bacterium]